MSVLIVQETKIIGLSNVRKIVNIGGQLKNKVGAPKKEHPKEPFGIRLHPFVKAAVRKIPNYNTWIQKLICKELDIDLGE